jgi:hypothetical protein
MPVFAKATDVETRLCRPLSDLENSAAAAAITTVTGLVVDCAGRDDAWAEALDPVPEALKSLCVEKAVGVIANPAGLTSQSETIGTYTLSQGFQKSESSALFLTPFEERLVSRAVYGTTTGSSLPVGMFDREIELSDFPFVEVNEDVPNPKD